MKPERDYCRYREQRDKIAKDADHLAEPEATELRLGKDLPHGEHCWGSLSGHEPSY